MIEIVMIGGFALILAVCLTYAARKFASPDDKEVDVIENILPGANCGACGFPGCREYASKVVKDHGLIGRCRPGGKEVADKISELFHEGKKEVAQVFAIVSCCGGKACGDRAVYVGIDRCAAAAIVGGGHKACTSGCLGFGDCVDSCRYGSIRMGKDGYPEVDEKKCVACGACVRTCPRLLIRLAKKEKPRLINVDCMSKDSGRDVQKRCSRGCIACGACVRACPVDAIKVISNLARIDYSVCIGCGKCVMACPKKVIRHIDV